MYNTVNSHLFSIPSSKIVMKSFNSVAQQDKMSECPRDDPKSLRNPKAWNDLSTLIPHENAGWMNII